MLTTIWARNRFATTLLLGATLILGVGFWRSNDNVVTFSIIIGGAGWLAWWYERAVSGGRSSEQKLDAKDTPLPGKRDNAARTPDRHDKRVKNPEVLCPPGSNEELASQIRLAITESNQAVSTAITSFASLASAAQDIADCAAEMQHWQLEDSNPLIQDAILHMAARSSTISARVEVLIGDFQFQDLLTQRLEYAASVLDPANQTGGNIRPNHGPELHSVNYSAVHTDDHNTTIF
jgi:hypothetical protein